MGNRLQRELKKRNPFDSPWQEAALAILRTADRLQIRFARLFRAHGLTPSQYNILRILRGEGASLPILEIASRTVTVVPGITGLVDRLEQAGFLRRRRCEVDRRVVRAELTEAGKEALASLDEPLARLHRELLGHFDSAEIGQLIALLDKARSRLAAAHESALPSGECHD